MNIQVKTRLKEILQEKGIKQNWLADKLNISKTTLSNIINNRYNTSLETAFKISIIINVALTDIFYYELLKK